MGALLRTALGQSPGIAFLNRSSSSAFEKWRTWQIGKLDRWPSVDWPGVVLVREQSPPPPLEALCPAWGMPTSSADALTRISHRRVGGARKSQLYGALREPIQNNLTCYQGFNSVRNPPFTPRFASRTLQVGEKCGLTIRTSAGHQGSFGEDCDGPAFLIGSWSRNCEIRT